MITLIENRLGKQPLKSLLLTMCTQTTFSLILYSMYGLTDAFYVSRGVGGYASAAVGVFSPVTVLIGGITTTVGTGTGSVLSRKLGAKEQEKAADAVGCMFFLWIVCAGLITFVGLSLFEPLIRLLGAAGQILPYIRDYGKILLAGTLISTGFSGVMRANGDISYSTLQWSLPVLLNMVLDPIFIYVFHMGISGAALATLVSQMVSMLTSLYYFFIRKKTPCRITIRHIRFHRALAGEIISVGLPSFLNNLGSSLIITVFNHMLSAAGGAMALGAYAILSRITSVLFTPFTGIMQGIQPIIGYNYGDRNYKRVRDTVRCAFLADFVYGLAITLFSLAGAGLVFRLFTSREEIRMIGMQALRILSLSFCVKGFVQTAAAYFQSTGNARTAFLLSVGSICFIQLPLLLAAGLLGNITFLFTACVVSDLVAAAWAVRIYQKNKL